MKQNIIRILKRTGKVLLILVLSFFSIGIIIGLFYGDEVKQLLVKELNKNLSAEITVKEIDFSILHHFPFASLDFKNVLIKEVVDRPEKDTLLYADHLSLLFNISNIFDKNFSVKKILVQSGTVKIRVDEKGKNNYHFWNASTASTSSATDSTGSIIDLEKILLEKMNVSYVNYHDKQDYLFTAKTGELSGKFSGDEFVLKTTADLFVSRLLVDNVNYIPMKPVKIKTVLQVNSKSGLYHFEESTVRIADLLFDVKGDVTSTKETTNLNLAVDAHEADLRCFISMMPPAMVKYFHDFNTGGKFIFSSTIKGKADGKHSPEVAVSFSVRNGKVSPKGNDIALDNVNMSGTYINHSAKGFSVLEIPQLNCNLSGRKVKADLRLDDLSNPFLTLHAQADFDLSDIKHFIKSDTLESLSGSCGLNVAFAGKIKDLPRYNSGALYKVNASGSVALKDVNFKLKRNPLEFKNINGNFSLNDNNININSLKGNISSTDFELNGTFRNCINFILIPDQEAFINASFASNDFNLDELLENHATASESDSSYKLKINPRLDCKLNVSVGKIHLRRFVAEKLRGEVTLNNQVITGHNLNYVSMGGDVTMDATINASRKDSVFISCNAKTTKLDITQLFFEMENFGQNVITDKNVKGKISAGVMFSSQWSTALVCNTSKIISQSDITIENGELNDFRPILPLSKYLKLADLNHIKFSTIKNQIQIRNRNITFPSMEINSSALNLTASGTHTFDNIVDYKLKMLLNDVLGKKVKSQNSEFGEIEDDGLGRSQLFLTMKGPVDNPKFAYDRKSVQAKIKDDFKKDGENVKQMLKQEFGLFKKDTLKVEKKKKEELQVDWDSKDDSN